MTTYYNENDPFAAAWLRKLMKEGLIYDGEVDERSIADVRAADLRGFTACHFFAGIGGWDHALDRAGWPAERKVWTGSCPCQPFSLAGQQNGFDDERHLWPVWRNLIEECRPATVFGEQVASATQWLGLVRGDLEAMGYAVGAIPIEAASAGAYHLRNRYWFVADADGGQSGARRGDAGEVRGISQAQRQPEHGAAVSGGSCTKHRGGVADADLARPQGRPLLSERAGQRPAGANGVEHATVVAEREPDDESHAVATGGQARPVPGGAGAWVIGADGKARRVEPGIRLLAHGIPNRVGLLRGFGNAIDPRPAQAFIEAYLGGPVRVKETQ
jgi:DNA (cytosine-5)-methyltransferase 1